MVDFDRLNRETKDYKNKNVDRFNYSTKSSYNKPNFNRLNSETYYQNNGCYGLYCYK